MDLGQRVNELHEKAKEHIFLPKNKEAIRGYLFKYDLKGYLNNTDQEKRGRYNRLLEQNIDRSFEKYKSDLESAISRFGGAAGAGIAGFDIINILAGPIPAGASTYAAGLLILGKTAMELPNVYHYLKNTKDLNGLYGLTMYGLRKAIGLSVPVLGPVIEGSALRDMFLKRILYESKEGFLRDIGKYESMYERVKNRVRDIAGEFEMPEKAYNPV